MFSRSALHVLAFVTLAGVSYVGLAAAKPVGLDVLTADGDGQSTIVTASGSTKEPAQVFTDTLQRYRRIQFDELVTGDVSLFPTIFYNDPRYPVRGEEWEQVVERAGTDAIWTLIASSASGPVGVESGFLSAKIAEHLGIWGNIEAWASIEATATAEGRPPTGAEVSSLPHGQLPYPRKHRDDRIEVPMHVFDIVVEGDHATAKWAFIEPEDAVGDWISSYGDVYEIFWFTRVEGQWYISWQESVLCPCTDEPPVQP